MPQYKDGILNNKTGSAINYVRRRFKKTGQKSNQNSQGRREETR